MARLHLQLSTGLPELDRVFRGIMAGDNIVWQIDTIEDYMTFVKPYADYAVENRQHLIYFHFANHQRLLSPQDGIEIVKLQPEKGFEYFLYEIHEKIRQAERGTLYLFDCLSKLAADWNSDRMLGNFFMLTCPYLYDRAAIAYFSILRNYHSFHAIGPISNTTQILIDAYHRKSRIYIQPRKVQHRHSSTMYMLHVFENDTFKLVTQSAEITDTLANSPWSNSDLASYKRGFWSKTFADAENLLERVERGEETVDPTYFKKLLHMLIAREGPLLELAQQFFTLKDLIDIRRRMIGTGLIGGKAVGMLLGRAILQKTDPKWINILEPHDSFYVGADVFYTYLVQNGCWWLMQRHKIDLSDDETETARRRILAGEFPEYIVKQFLDLLEYFGQSPIIVRSSSLLEDNFGNAFAGKYDSVFCANQGSIHKRLEDFLFAVRTVYASTMSEAALSYRRKRGLLKNDEQMALLIQRVSGDLYGHFFFPQAAGVAFSFNPYMWHKSIDPNSGVIRIVFGIGTRAVDRADDDYTRIIALNQPSLRPEAGFDMVKQYAQRKVDVLDIEANQLKSMNFNDIAEKCIGIPFEYFASKDLQMEKELRNAGKILKPTPILTFDKLINDTPFITVMREMLDTLKKTYNYNVDVEFTLNFFDKQNFMINLVQCRPLQIANENNISLPTENVTSENLLISTKGIVIGRNFSANVDWIIYVKPQAYSTLPIPSKHETARLIGEITHHPELSGKTIFLIGPGRWCTSSPELGVPVIFSDINNVNIICEMATMRDNLIPDVSLGTHFFNELVENNMVYIAFLPNTDGNSINENILNNAALNHLPKIIQTNNEKHFSAINLIKTDEIKKGCKVVFYSDVMAQRASCHLLPSK